MMITRQGFSQIVGNAFAGFGFPAEAPTIYEFPMEMFLADSDLTPINENIDKIIYGLTEWEPEVKETGLYTPSKVKVEGRDYQEALDAMHHLFLRNMWGDGLSLSPATEEKVDWILTGTDLPRDAIVGEGEGKVLPRGGIATVEAIAVALAMAGGRPEYLQVLIAAVEAMLKPRMRMFHWMSTTASTYPVVIVNGPMAKQIRLNSGYGCLGPDPNRSAGGSIGRALRLIQMNLGGAIAGIGTMALFGAGDRYTNIVFAEDEDGIPPTWKPLSLERGYPVASNVATMYVVEGTVNVHIGGAGVPSDEETAHRVLRQLAGFMGVPSTRYYAYTRQPDYLVGIVLFARGTIEGLANLGWSKEMVQTFLWENSKLPWSVVERTRTPAQIDKDIEGREELFVKGQPWPITPDPKNIMIAVAGGAQSGHFYWMQGANGPEAATDAEIKLPANWDELLKQAEEDLGPLPAD
jgi:hypothetical protein